MNDPGSKPAYGDSAEDAYAIKLLGRRCFETAVEIEAVSRPWVMHDVPRGHSFGRLPDETEIRPWPIPRTTGLLLNYLIRANRLKHGVEIGTSLGYSALFIGSALAENSGHLDTCEIFPPKIELAKRHLEKSGLANIRLIEGEAREHIRGWSSPVDFLFLDADPESYSNYFAVLAPCMKSGSLLVMDNAVNHNSITEPFIREVASNPEWESHVLPIDHGLLLAHKR